MLIMMKTIVLLDFKRTYTDRRLKSTILSELTQNVLKRGVSEVFKQIWNRYELQSICKAHLAWRFLGVCCHQKGRKTEKRAITQDTLPA